MSGHLKRLSAPKTWPIHRKELTWITRPNPSGQSLNHVISINVVLREMLKYTNSTRETRKVLNEGNILINGNIRKDPKTPLGLFDILALPSKEQFRLLFNKQGKLTLHEIKAEEAGNIIEKITNKKILKGKKIQLNFQSGRNLLVEKDEYKTDDSLILDKDGKIQNHLKLEKGATIYLIAGKHISATGKVESIEGTKVEFKSEDKKMETLKKYAYVIGKDKSIITLPK